MMKLRINPLVAVELKKVTPKMVKISLGLRSPDLYDITKDGIREIPDTLKKFLLII